MHVPVLVEETLQDLITDPTGVYVDLNLGYGGHGEAICRRLGDHEYRYVGIDLDRDALEAAGRRLARFGDRVVLIEGNHRHFLELLARAGMGPVTGILLDLGQSSAQLDSTERGFGYDRSSPLDMRFGHSGPTAADLLQDLDERELADAFRTYGDVRGARRLARAIVYTRHEEPLRTTADLRGLVERTLRPSPRIRPKVLAQVFQAVRVLVNDEVESFRLALEDTHRAPRPGGVLSVIAYESVTDRMVKHTFRPPDPQRDTYGRLVEPPRWDPLRRRAVRPTEEEVGENPRSRSARLRSARKLDVADGESSS